VTSTQNVLETVLDLLRRHAIFDEEQLSDEKYITTALWILASHAQAHNTWIELTELERLIGPVNDKAKQVISKLAATYEKSRPTEPLP
jgi:hypothetical protein